MKIFVGTLILCGFGGTALAQDQRVAAPRAPEAKVAAAKAIQDYTKAATEYKVQTALAGGSEKIVKNSPFTAEAVSESVQTLADGNRIVHKSTSKLYRNSEGRFRREMNNGSGSILGTYYSYGPGVTILDPVAGSKFLLDDKLKTAQQQALTAASVIKLKTEAAAMSDDQKAAAKRLTELSGQNKMTVIRDGIPAGATAPVAAGRLTIAGDGIPATGWAISSSSKYESKTEQLGVQNIEGVEAEGTRTTTTIPAEAIGNERPIEIVYERWFSKDLQLVVMSKNSDPRTGEQTYRLTNILRTEPDPSLFTVPQGYRTVMDPDNYTVTGDGGSIYRVSARPVGVRPVAIAKTASAPTPVAKPVVTPAPAAKPNP